MNFINQSTTFFNATQMMTTSAYLMQQNAGDDNTEKSTPIKEKGKGIKGLLKSLNPVRIFSKIFSKKEQESLEEEREI